MVSASALPEHRTIAQAAGADFHVAKPVHFDTLIAAVDACLADLPG